MFSEDEFENFTRRFQDKMAESDSRTGKPSQINESEVEILANQEKSVTTDTSQFMATITALLQQNSQMMELLKIQTEKAVSSATNVPEMRTVTVVPDLTKTIDSFDGEGDSLTAKSWLGHVRNSAALHNWSDAMLLQTVPNHLIGAARYWYQGKMSEIKSWAELRQLLEKHLCTKKGKVTFGERCKNECNKLEKILVLISMRKWLYVKRAGFHLKKLKSR